MKRILIYLLLATFMSGCTYITTPIEKVFHPKAAHKPTYWERYGKVFYLDGAGGMGFGQDIPRALRAAGFRGDVENISWTSHTGPLGDQMIRVVARKNAEKLKEKIVNYHTRYPNAPIYIIGLSAGTGVAVWGVEALPKDVEIESIVLLSSSLNSNYDMSTCLSRVRSRVYVYYSPNDGVLRGFIPLTGTIDGEYFKDPAGLVGMKPPRTASKEMIDLYNKKIVNIGWRPSFERLGYSGGHTDATSYKFVRYEIARRMGI